MEKDYETDLGLIIQKYNELGYRDAKILSDSVTAYKDNLVDVHIDIEEGQKYYISNISWAGNTIYPSSTLDAILGMKAGDVYNQKLLNKRTLEDDDAVANLYMNNGYLFFQARAYRVENRGRQRCARDEGDRGSAGSHQQHRDQRQRPPV